MSFPNATCLDLITDVLQAIGEYQPGETPNSEDANYCQAELNQLLDSLGLDRLWLFDAVRTAQTINPSQYIYTLGQNGTPDWNTPRPNLIQTVSVIDSAGVTHPLNVLDSKKWAAIKQKGVATAPLPEDIYFDGNYPNETIYLNPVPTALSTIEIFGWMALFSFPSLVTLFPNNPGYYRAIKYLLSISVAPAFGKPPDQAIAALAEDAVNRLKTFNAQILASSLGPTRTLDSPNIGQIAIPQPAGAAGQPAQR